MNSWLVFGIACIVFFTIIIVISAIVSIHSTHCNSLLFIEQEKTKREQIKLDEINATLDL